MSANQHTPKNQTTTFWTCLLIACLSLFTAACGQGFEPCQSADDCMAGEQCFQGNCQPTEKTPSTSTKDEPKKTDEPKDEPKKTDTPRDEPKKPKDEPITCDTPRPVCKDKGSCKGTQATCEKGAWRCSYPKTYEKEEYSCDGKDNDCDGLVDEDCDCSPGDQKPCGLNVGECKQGNQTCQDDGRWGACVGATKPQVEICDGKDNDCDGSVDETLFRGCYEGPAGTQGKGSCKGGKQICESGQWSACQGAVLPQTETCDGVDNDCDGNIDEDIQRACYSGPLGTQGKGVCKAGTQVCNAGSWSTCQGEILPQTETCDGVDNDCDGSVDENIQRACYTGPANTKGVGTCRGGTQVCNAGRWGTCQGELTPTAEVCDGTDNDCDGSVDENIQRACYTGPAGTQNKGTCQGGTQVCSAGRWGTCQGQVLPQAETCDGKDNNCDGIIDDNPRSICGARKVCQQARCICDQTQGAYPHGNTCLKEGDSCPATLRQRSICATTSHWMICDPYGQVGILSCPQFSGTQCIKVAGGEGCQAPPSYYATGSCIQFNTNNQPARSWQAVMYGIGPSPNLSILTFDHCVGRGRNACSNIITSAGYQAICTCGERKINCGGETVYDVNQYTAYDGTCSYHWGDDFGCFTPLNGKNACKKTFVRGFATYTCGP